MLPAAYLVAKLGRDQLNGLPQCLLPCVMTIEQSLNEPLQRTQKPSAGPYIFHLGQARHAA